MCMRDTHLKGSQAAVFPERGQSLIFTLYSHPTEKQHLVILCSFPRVTVTRLCILWGFSEYRSTKSHFRSLVLCCGS